MNAAQWLDPTPPALADWLDDAALCLDSQLANGCHIRTYRLPAAETYWSGATHATTAIDEAGWACEAGRYHGWPEALNGHFATRAIYADPTLIDSDPARTAALAALR